MDRGAQQATVLGVTKSHTQLSVHAYTKLFRHYSKGSGKPLKYIKQQGATIRNHTYENSLWVLCGLGGSTSGMADQTGPLSSDTAGISVTGDMKRIRQNLEAESRGLGRRLNELDDSEESKVDSSE